MAEPEGLLIEAARLATTATRGLWSRVSQPDERRRLPLSRIRERLELFLAALYPDTPRLLPADPPPAPVWLARLVGRAPGHLHRRIATATTDGRHIWLPRDLDASEGDDRALATYRLLAVEQAARVARGTPAHAARARADALERDLYLLAEAVAIDRAIAVDLPGLVSDLRTARIEALAERPPLERLTPLECAVERMIRDALSGEIRSPARAAGPSTATPSESRVWAQDMARHVRSVGGRYRGVAAVAVWGQIKVGATPPPVAATTADEHAITPPPRSRSATLRQRPAVREPGDDEDDGSPGTWMVRMDEPMESAEDPMGLQRPADQDASAAPEDLADSLSELPELRMVRTPGAPPEILESDAATAPPHAVATAVGRAGATGVVYPEWDYRTAAYRSHGAVVWPSIAASVTGPWVDHVMARHAALVKRVRRRFDGLRPRHVRLNRQMEGADIDLAAYVTAFADWRAGQSGDDRLYSAAHPARRNLAIMLLIDMSASTDSWVAGNQRIIDVEKEALIVLLEALDALGDQHAILGFSGHGPGDVRLLTIKAFEEPLRDEVRRRIAALEPDRYTRAGAAIRHATAVLAAHAAGHRLLLMLSDGKPNDVDEYEGRYGIEDTRRAVIEARQQGLVPFCLTVDREAAAYVPAVFGRNGYALLRRPEALPHVLVDVTRTLLTASTCPR